MRSAIRAELLKILTVPGQRTGALLAVLALPLVSLLVVTTGKLGERDTVISGTATGTVVALLAFGAWGAAVAGSEYAHRTITVSLALVPARPRLFAAKSLAVALVAGAGALVSVLLAWLLVAAAKPPGHRSGNPAALLAVIAAVVAVAVVGLAIGFATRSATGAIATVLAVVLAPKAAAGLLGSLQAWVIGASPGTVVTQVVHGGQLASDQTFPGGTALAVLSMVAVSLLVLAGSGWAFVRRDG